MGLPKDDAKYLKTNWGKDVLSGFLAFVLALLLSLGIASTRGLLAAMGVLSVMMAGLLLKFIFRILNGVPISGLFKAKYTVNETEKSYVIYLKDAAIFSNLRGYKKMWDSLKPDKNITFNFTEAKLVDHDFMDQLHQLEEDRHATGNFVTLIGLDKFNPLSRYPSTARETRNDKIKKIEIHLSQRQAELNAFADHEEFNFYPQKVRNAIKFKGFPIQNGNKIQYEENILAKYTSIGRIDVSDVTLSEGAIQEQNDSKVTLIQITEIDFMIPDFALEPGRLWSRFSELANGKDIDFKSFPKFSTQYYLRGENEDAIREFFNESLIQFLEEHEETHIESHKNKLLLYKKRDMLNTSEIQSIITFAEELLNVILVHHSK